MIVTVVLGVIAVLLLGVWGFPFTLIIAALAFGYVFAARKRDPSVGRIESGRTPEPTGRPRASTGGAETANQRQGQR